MGADGSWITEFPYTVSKWVSKEGGHRTYLPSSSSMCRVSLASRSIKSCWESSSGSRRGIAPIHTRNRSIFGFLSPLQCHTVRHLYNVTHTANRSILGFLSPLQRHTVRHLYNVTHTHGTDRSLASSLRCNVTQCDICTMSHIHTANRSIFGFLSPLQRHTVRHLYNVTHTHS